LPDVSALADDYLDAAQLYIICGQVSGNFEVIDIDVKHDPEKKIFIRYKELIQSVNQGLFDRLLIERSPTQGYHLCYRCAIIGRNQKLAYTPDNEVLIETRAEGGGIVCAPSPGYILVRGSFSDIPEITPQERDFLFNAARVLSQKKEDPVFQSKTESARPGASSACDDFDQTADILYWLQQHGWQITAKKGEVYWLKRPGDSDNAHSATWNFIPGRFWCWSTSTAFENEKLYKPYAVFAVLECGSDFKEAARRLYEMGYGEKREFKSESAGQETKAQAEPVQTPGPDHEYFRVGINYFKKIQVTDIHGNQIEKIIKWSKDELILDHGKKFVYGLAKYDSFIVRPSHLEYKHSIGRSYNLYGKISHEVISGTHASTTAFIKHIFGDKETIFLDYLTILWQKPTQILPVICLVSEKRQTGKTTMLKWLRALFQNNAAILKNETSRLLSMPITWASC
jgi:hypothetical protein